MWMKTGHVGGIATVHDEPAGGREGPFPASHRRHVGHPINGWPTDADDVEFARAAATRHGAPLTPGPRGTPKRDDPTTEPLVLGPPPIRQRLLKMPRTGDLPRGFPRSPPGSTGLGHRRGLTTADGDDHAPVPAALTAATRNTYLAPLLKPVTVAEFLLDTPSENRTQPAPLLLYSIR